MTRPTLDEVKAWPATCSISDGCRALGFSKSHGYELATRGEFPVRVMRVGGRWVVITAELIRFLGGEAADVVPAQHMSDPVRRAVEELVTALRGGVHL